MFVMWYLSLLYCFIDCSFTICVLSYGDDSMCSNVCVHACLCEWGLIGQNWLPAFRNFGAVSVANRRTFTRTPGPAPGLSSPIIQWGQPPELRLLLPRHSAWQEEQQVEQTCSFAVSTHFIDLSRLQDRCGSRDSHLSKRHLSTSEVFPATADESFTKNRLIQRH